MRTRSLVYCIFEGEGVAIEPGNDEEKNLVEVKEERKVGRNN